MFARSNTGEFPLCWSIQRLSVGGVGGWERESRKQRAARRDKGGGKRTKEGRCRRWPRDVAHEEVHTGSGKLIYVLGRSWPRARFLRVRGRTAVSVHAVAARVCDTGGFQQRAIYQAAHLLPVALNRQTDKGDLAVEKRRKRGKEEARQKKNRRICQAVREGAEESLRQVSSRI